jgi:hypothetical protein
MATVGPSNIANSIHAEPRFNVGALYTDEGTNKTYRYVCLASEASVAAVLGALVYYTSDLVNNVYTVTTDESDGIAPTLGGGCAGVWVNPTQTAGVGFDGAHYAWVQVGGVANVQGDGNVAAADLVTASTTDGVAVENSVGGGFTIGVALEDDSAETDTVVRFKCRLTGLA